MDLNGAKKKKNGFRCFKPTFMIFPLGVLTADTSFIESPDAEVSSPPPPSSRATYQDLVSSRRRRRQRQAYSALQLSTLEGEFKVNA